LFVDCQDEPTRPAIVGDIVLIDGTSAKIGMALGFNINMNPTSLQLGRMRER
jgi:hypothetical protein